MTYRTAPFAAIPATPLSRVNDHTAHTITRIVTIPGLTTRDGAPLTVEQSYTLHEIDGDWVSVIVDYDFGSDPAVYGNHPLAVSPLRDILPDAYPLPAFPAHARTARDKVVAMLTEHHLGGTVTIAPGGNALEYRFTATDDTARQSTLALVREYIPFQATVWADDSRDCIVIRRPRTTQEDS